MTIKVKITHATGINKISMPSVQSKRSKLAKKGGGVSPWLLPQQKVKFESSPIYNFAHELNLSFCSLINYSSMAPTFHRTDLTKRRMLSTLISRFIPFSLKTNTSSTLEPTCWPSSDNLIKHKINHHHVTAIFKHFNSHFSNFGTSKLIRNFRQVIPNNICCSWQKTMLINFCLIGVVSSPCKKKQQLRKRSWLLYFING